MTTIESRQTFPAACAAAWASPAQRDRVALEFGASRLTYASLAVGVDAAAGTLRVAGIRRGDLVLLIMKRSFQMVVNLYGVIFAGGCPAPIEAKLGVEEIDARIAAIGIAWVLYDAANAELAAALALDPSRKIAAGTPALAGWRHDGLGREDRGLLVFADRAETPRGVLQSHGNLLNSAAGVIERTGLSPSDRLLNVMPVHHVNALNNQLFAPHLVGATVIFPDRFRSGQMPALMESYRPTVVTGTPPLYARALKLDFAPAALAGLRMAHSAPLAEDLHRRVEAKFGCPLVVSFGLSEATCTSLMNPPDSRRIGTVGTPLRGQTVRVLAPAGLDEVPTGEEGEIAIAGDDLMLGHLGARPEADRAIEKGWLRTGSLGRFDRDGYLTVTGRRKDAIVRAGQTLSPQAIETVIDGHPLVGSVCVVGQPHVRLGEVPVAFVVAADGFLPDAEEIRELVERQLSPIYRPEEVYYLEAMPETAVGEIDRKALSTRARQASH